MIKGLRRQRSTADKRNAGLTNGQWSLDHYRRPLQQRCLSRGCYRSKVAMAYMEDLSNYVYAGSVFGRPGTKAIGWLALGHEFPKMTPEDETLDLLWQYCSISVAEMRGGHDCEFCPSGSARRAVRDGEERLLCVAEIRVFSRDGQIYAAPTLIYHYVAVHRYKPPDEFLEAMRAGPRPPSQEYFDVLARLNLEWSKTSTGW
jgi:hypothetical protein